MRYLHRLAVVTALALAALALTAVSASADIIDTTTGLPYTGAVSGTETGSAPTLSSGSVVISCDSATVSGTIDDGTAPGMTGSLAFTFGGTTAATNDTCQTIAGGAATCTVDPIGTGNATDATEPTNVGQATPVNVEYQETITAGENQSFSITGPDMTIANTELGATTVTCGGVFSCTASANTSTSQVTAVVDAETDVAEIDDTVDLAGLIGCSLGAGNWTAQYTVVPNTLEDDSGN
jgi:hypothetical protein